MNIVHAISDGTSQRISKGARPIAKSLKKRIINEFELDCAILSNSFCIFSSILSGDESLSQRPMNRVSKPLINMNANIKTSNGKPPIFISPVDEIKNVDHKIHIASAQIKSAIMLAGLYGRDSFTITTPKSRDHTEIMLNEFGCNITQESDSINVTPSKLTSPKTIDIPGDISSAAFFIV